MTTNFANVDFNDRAAVDRLLDDLSRVARQAWMEAAERAEGEHAQAASEVRASDLPAQSQDVMAVVGAATARAAEANLLLLKSQAEMARRFFTASFDAYQLLCKAVVERNTSTVERVINDMRKLETEARNLEERVAEVAASTVAESPSNSKKRAA